MYDLLTQAHCILFRDSLHTPKAWQFNYRNTSNTSGNITNQISEPQYDILTRTQARTESHSHTYQWQLTGNMQMHHAFKLGRASEMAAQAASSAMQHGLERKFSLSHTHIRKGGHDREAAVLLRKNKNNNNN